jgi:small-conductance mechanosensitive channel
MNTLTDVEALIDAARTLLAEPGTWWQLTLVAGSFLLSLLAGHLLQKRMQPMVQSGTVAGVGRTAIRTGALAIIPLIWWLLLLAAKAWLRRHGQATDIVQGAVYLVGALALIRMGVFVLRHSFSPGSKLKAWEWSLTVTIWCLVALHMLGLLPVVIEVLDEHAVKLGQARISLYTIVSFVLSIALLSLVALWLTNGIQALLKHSEALDDSVKLVLGKITRFLLLMLAVVVAMVTAGIDLTALAVFGGALGVGLGLGLQRIVSNFVSGIVLAFEESVRPGDVLSVGSTFGVVQALHARHIVVRDRDGRDILIPNEALLTSEIVNWSYGDRNMRFHLPVQVSYHDDPEQAMALMEQAARVNERVLADPGPEALLAGFGDNGINLELYLWIHDPENGVNNVRSDVFLRIWQLFREAGITIPSPQHDVRLIPLHQPVPAPAPSAGRRGSRQGSADDRTPDSPADSPG